MNKKDHNVLCLSNHTKTSKHHTIPFFPSCLPKNLKFQTNFEPAVKFDVIFDSNQKRTILPFILIVTRKLQNIILRAINIQMNIVVTIQKTKKKTKMPSEIIILPWLSTIKHQKRTEIPLKKFIGQIWICEYESWNINFISLKKKSNINWRINMTGNLVTRMRGMAGNHFISLKKKSYSISQHKTIII